MRALFLLWLLFEVDTLWFRLVLKTLYPHLKIYVCVSLQQADRVDVEMVEEVCVGRASIGALVFHKVALQGLLATVALLYHPQLKKNDTQEVTLSKASPVLGRANLYTAALHIHTKRVSAANPVCVYDLKSQGAAVKKASGSAGKLSCKISACSWYITHLLQRSLCSR